MSQVGEKELAQCSYGDVIEDGNGVRFLVGNPTHDRQGREVWWRDRKPRVLPVNEHVTVIWSISEILWSAYDGTKVDYEKSLVIQEKQHEPRRISPQAEREQRRRSKQQKPR